MKAFYTTKEARELLGLSHINTVSEYINRGFLEAVKIGRDWIINGDSLRKRLVKQGKIISNMEAIQ